MHKNVDRFYKTCNTTTLKKKKTLATWQVQLLCKAKNFASSAGAIPSNPHDDPVRSGYAVPYGGSPRWPGLGHLSRHTLTVASP